MTEYELPKETVLSFETGSRIICNPPVTTTDLDVVILVPTEQWEQVVDRLQREGWRLGGSRVPGSNWASLKKDYLNFLVTGDSEWYFKMELATKVATKLNLVNKQDRILVFHSIVEGKLPR